MMAKHPITENYNKVLTDDELWESLGLEYNFTAGTPILCSDRLIIKGDGKATFSTIRSRMDLAGEEIGNYEGEIDKEHVRELFQQLKDSGFESLPPEEGSISGASRHRLAITIGGAYAFSSFSTFPTAIETVDDKLREIINTVRENKLRVLKLTIDISKPAKGKPIDVTINFPNLGTEPFFIRNPKNMKQTKRDVFAVEYGLIPEEKPGFTSPPIQWKQVKLEELKVEKDELDYIRLEPGATHSVKATKAVTIDEPGKYLIHAIFGDYELNSTVAGVPILRGHAVSEDVEVSIK
jgi:hypothetical protein